MTDHLSLMDIQRWQLRSIPEAVPSETVQLKPEVISTDFEENIKANATINEAKLTKEVSRPSSITAFSAYAAISERIDAAGKKSRWLWVVPQSTLPSNELKLLDKIVLATSSRWESVSVADSYLTEEQLNYELKTLLSAIVVFGNIADDVWSDFFSHDMYKRQRFFMGTSLQEMIKDSDKKRLVWQSLQALMLGD